MPNNDNEKAIELEKDSEMLTIYRKVNPDTEVAIMQKKLAAFLLLRNCKLTNVGFDKKEPWRSIFFFKKSPMLSNAMRKYHECKDALGKISTM